MKLFHSERLSYRRGLKLMIPALCLLVCAAEALAAPEQAGTKVAEATTQPPASGPASPDSITLFFSSGSTAIRPDDAAKLDHAARLFRDAHPIVMQVAGSSDTVGNAETNLKLSQRRADAVFRGLVERGIPASRFQILAKGETDLADQTKPGVPDQRNRSVQITWR